MVTYKESTAGWLDHYFGNKVEFMGRYHCNSELRSIVQEIKREGETQTDPWPVRLKQEFCEGLQSKLDVCVPELRGVTHDHLREMIALAQGDWNDVETIKKLYRRYSEIRKEDYDLEKLFKEQR